jgi:3-oxoadipate enol-lactonase
MIVRGSGVPLVLVPGIQGRWEWMQPAVEALARRCLVVTYSLDERVGAAGRRRRLSPVEPRAGIAPYVDQLDRVLDAAGLASAALCGVSFGGLVALYYAAERPARVEALVLVSTPGPAWRPDWRARLYARFPRLLAPAFVLHAPVRLGPEMVAAADCWLDAARSIAAHLLRVALAPFSPAGMGARARPLASLDATAVCARVRTPTLVLTGEPALDRVVSVAETRQYARLIPGAATAVLERTGHIGLVTRPERFAEIVGTFLADVRRLADQAKNTANGSSARRASTTKERASGEPLRASGAAE